METHVKCKEKRVVNLPKDDYEQIKTYCQENDFKLPHWLVKLAKEKMAVETVTIKAFEPIIQCPDCFTPIGYSPNVMAYECRHCQKNITHFQLDQRAKLAAKGMKLTLEDLQDLSEKTRNEILEKTGLKT